MKDLQDMIGMAVPDAEGLRERRRRQQDSAPQEESEFQDLAEWWNTGEASGATSGDH